MIRLLRFAVRVAIAMAAAAAVFAYAHAQTVPDVTPQIVVQAASDHGLSAKGSDLTWPTAAAVTAWRLVDLGGKVIDQVRAMFDRWLDTTGGRIPVSIRYTSQSVHTEVDPEPTQPIRVQTTDYEGPDRRGGRRKLRDVGAANEDEEEES